MDSKMLILYMNFKSIDLAETIDKDTLVYEKIAPGTSGSFNILLDSNQEIRMLQEDLILSITKGIYILMQD